MTNRDPEIPPHRATGSTFRTVCLALHKASGGEKVRIESESNEMSRFVFDMSVNICRSVIPFNSKAGDLIITSKPRRIVFPNEGILLFETYDPEINYFDKHFLTMYD